MLDLDSLRIEELRSQMSRLVEGSSVTSHDKQDMSGQEKCLVATLNLLHTHFDHLCLFLTFPMYVVSELTS